MKSITLIACLLVSLKAYAQSGTNLQSTGTAKPSAAATTVANESSREEQTVALSSLDMSHVLQGDLWPQANRSAGQRPLQLGGVKFENGLGTHARSVLWIDLQGGSRRFSASVGVDDEVVSPTVLRELITAFKLDIRSPTSTGASSSRFMAMASWHDQAWV